MMKPAVVILTGGGPAPGVNTVVGSIVKTFLANDYRVIGLHEGYSGLFSKEPIFEELSYDLADVIFKQGGSYLKMSRFKPSDENFTNDFNLSFFIDNNVELLITIGGDDTASTANRVAQFLAKNDHKISNIHVPKTIDNDLPLPGGAPTFGYQSAKNEGAHLAHTLYEDARTSQNWFIVSTMGRSAGHLAFGIGTSCQYPMIIIPEMFNKTKISVENIVNLVISSIIKRRLMGMKYGAAIISEGVFHVLDEKEIEASGVTFSYDVHGHPELGKLSKAHVFHEMIEKRLKELSIKVNTRPVDIGYEMRCQSPIAYDLNYCTLLGMGTYKLFKDGHTGCMVYVGATGEIEPLFLKDIQGTDGKILPRLVDINSPHIKLVIENLFSYITPADYDAAKEYVENPEEFNMMRILNW